MTDTASDFVDVPLKRPLVRGETTYTTVRLRKPGGSELHGLSLVPLLQMDVKDVQTLLPRISNPVVHRGDFAGDKPAIDVADLVKMASEVAGFLLGTDN
ncbi:phage tail assembly protein [Caulobacter segnis]|uniref:Phage tail assembly protein n=1 Tax=Caulobacter segnis TaxID=88688 RepID=A0A2W5VFG4_9CAUL|nr:phage tail assembly protein [Caulobacter segnis]PZR37187.1 MAG: phage tail assembly protein [Caulobacter segnis]